MMSKTKNYATKPIDAYCPEEGAFNPRSHGWDGKGEEYREAEGAFVAPDSDGYGETRTDVGSFDKGAEMQKVGRLSSGTV